MKAPPFLDVLRPKLFRKLLQHSFGCYPTVYRDSENTGMRRLIRFQKEEGKGGFFKIKLVNDRWKYIDCKKIFFKMEDIEEDRKRNLWT